MNPFVSVVVSTYKRPILLKKALDSILAQTYADIEVICVGDCCPDMNSIKPNYPQVRFFNLKKNMNGGGAEPRNYGILKATGEYIVHCDDDNIFLPNHISSLMETLQNSNATWAFSSMQARGRDFCFTAPVKSGIDTSCVLFPKDFIAYYGMWISRSIDFCHDFTFFNNFVKGGEPWVATNLPTLIYNVDTCGAKAWFEQKLRTLPEVKT